MTIFIDYTELRQFEKIVKENKVRHGPFRKTTRLTNGGQVGYEIDILDPGPIETYFKLKFKS